MRALGRGSQVLMALILAGAAPALGQSSEGSAEPQGALPSVELPEDFARVLRDYERHWSEGQAEELAALFVEAGLIVSNGSWIRGRSAITEAYRHASGPLRLRAVEYASDGDLGYIIGAYGYGEVDAVQDRGLFVLTLRRAASGRWLIVSDMDRSGG